MSTAIRPRVLVVEDDSGTAELVRDVLADEGYDLSLFTNGRAALDWLRSHDVDLIVADLLMPGVGGREVVERYRAGGGTAAVVVVSAASEAASRAEALDASLVTKPFDVDEFLMVVRRSLARRG